MEAEVTLDEIRELLETVISSQNSCIECLNEIIGSLNAINGNFNSMLELSVMVLAALGFIGGTTLFRHLRK